MKSPWIQTTLEAIIEKNGQDTSIVDVGDAIGITDYFVITTGRNSRQVRALVEEIERLIKKGNGPSPKRMEGNQDYKWVLMDYGDFIVHVFDSKEHEYYQLDKLWSDMPTEKLIES
ncbi:MAG: ribosome silencing factor [Acidimicrobiales bacterium]|jgi:ribosome-associated protein|nr:ribosome silencing factor [Acidimicrobiales bacterium]MDP6298689.1 ribosome silencing factor [Acidimicrobiales bacterium]HJM27826.1 ribosome silencing factor [Acidimicrobiales bacterium]HJM97236.1 ribosome silencing factor [Acidimicrobiales bacterium]